MDYLIMSVIYIIIICSLLSVKIYQMTVNSKKKKKMLNLKIQKNIDIAILHNNYKALNAMLDNMKMKTKEYDNNEKININISKKVG